MDNLTINIHFFRNAQKGRIDYAELLKYFQEQPNFEIEYDDHEVNLIYTDVEFGFKYMYQITKVSKVKGVYKLNPAFLNINFLLCLPLLIPSYAVKEILNFALKIAKQFDLEVFHQSFSDVRSFNTPELYSLFSSEQKKYLENNELKGKVFLDTTKLNAICKYQRYINNLIEAFHHEVSVNPCKPIYDYNNKEFGISTTWNVGVATLFAPYFNYVDVKDENGECFLVRREDFMKFMEKYLTQVEDSLPDMYYIKPKAAKSSRGVAAKLRKYAIVDQTFEDIPICNILDRY